MAFVKTCGHYAVFVYPNETDVLARINLYCADNNKLYVLFKDLPVGELPPNTYNQSAKVGVAYAPLSQYPNYIDLIRNEAPIKVTFRSEDNPPRYVVYASQEEPGEGEM